MILRIIYIFFKHQNKTFFFQLRNKRVFLSLQESYITLPYFPIQWHIGISVSKFHFSVTRRNLVSFRKPRSLNTTTIHFTVQQAINAKFGDAHVRRVAISNIELSCPGLLMSTNVNDGVRGRAFCKRNTISSAPVTLMYKIQIELQKAPIFPLPFVTTSLMMDNYSDEKILIINFIYHGLIENHVQSALCTGFEVAMIVVCALLVVGMFIGRACLCFLRPC